LYIFINCEHRERERERERGVGENGRKLGKIMER
jgi:hypothetical protein